MIYSVPGDRSKENMKKVKEQAKKKNERSENEKNKIKSTCSGHAGHALSFFLHAAKFQGQGVK